MKTSPANTTSIMISIHWIFSLSIKLSCLLFTTGEIRTDRFGARCPRNLKLSRTPDVAYTVASKLECAALCSNPGFCIGFNYDRVAKSCDLFRTGTLPADCSDPEIVNAEGSTLFENYVLCENDGVWTGTDCECRSSWVGERCERLAVDCSEIFDYCPSCGPVFSVHVIQPPGGDPFPVKCYLDWGGYTYITERFSTQCDNRVSFVQDWAAYRDGFGDTATFQCDFWLGLAKIHRLTALDPSRAYILDTTMVFKDSSMNPVYQTYLTDFYIEDEANGFRFHASGWYDGVAGREAGDGYYRTPGDGESTVGERFSTYDRDQDSSATHCAQTNEVGWWYGDCGVALPTGIWQESTDIVRDTTRGTMWWGADSFFNDRALKKLDMKMKGQNQ